MVEILILAHCLSLALIYRRLSKLIGRIIAIVYLTYFSAFTILKPALLYYYDLFYPYSTNDQATVISLLSGSLLFLVIQFLGIRFLAKRALPQFALKLYDFGNVPRNGVFFAFAFLMLVSYVGCTIKFQNPLYMLTAVDAFEATNSLANGSWYINYLAEILFYGLLMTVAVYHKKLPRLRSLCLLVALLALTYVWVKITARTGILVILITWAACVVNASEQRNIKLVYFAAFGYFLLVLLYIGNLLRAGSAETIDINTALFGAVLAAASDLSPVDNAAMLYNSMADHASTHFIQLLGSITPLVLIPSSIFPFKVPADKDAELTRIFFPDGADTAFYHEGSTLTYTVPASGYADAGYLGVIVASIVYLMLFCFYLSICRRGSPSAKFIAVFFMLNHIIGFRLSVETLLISFYTSLAFIGLTRWLTSLYPIKRARQKAIQLQRV